MFNYNKLVQLAVFVIIITCSTTTSVFAAPKPLETSADIGNSVGVRFFKLIPKGANKSETWLYVSAEISVTQNRNSKVIQTLPIEDIQIDKPNFDIMDVNSDGYKDLLLYNATAGFGPGPSTSADVFIYAPKLKKFVKSKTLSGKGNIVASNKKGCVIVNYKNSEQGYTDEELCFNLKTGKWRTIKTTFSEPAH